MRGPSGSPPSNRRFGRASPRVVAAGASGAVVLEYLEDAPLFAEGLATGKAYRFSPLERIQTVEERDAAALLRTRFFRQIR
jgi:hypothetical protein